MGIEPTPRSLIPPHRKRWGILIVFREIPRSRRRALTKPLEIFANRYPRDEAMARADLSSQHTMAVIARHFGILFRLLAGRYGQSHKRGVVMCLYTTCPNTVRLAVRAELVEAHLPFDRLRANELKRTVLRPAPSFCAIGLRGRTAAALRPCIASSHPPCGAWPSAEKNVGCACAPYQCWDLFVSPTHELWKSFALSKHNDVI